MRNLQNTLNSVLVEGYIADHKIAMNADGEYGVDMLGVRVSRNPETEEIETRAMRFHVIGIGKVGEQLADIGRFGLKIRFVGRLDTVGSGAVIVRAEHMELQQAHRSLSETEMKELLDLEFASQRTMVEA